MVFLEVLKGLWLAARDIVPLSGFLIVFQVVVLKSPISNPKSLIAGLLMTTVGLFLFVQGLKTGLMPLGTSVGSSLPALKSPVLLTVFAFVLGFTTTLAEPALASLAMQIEEVSVGAMPNRVLITTVALGVGIGMALGVLKILYKVPSTYVLIPMVVLAAVLGYIAPERITGIGFDSGAVTTGPVTVPLNMALAIGLANVIGGTDPLVDGFGLIACAMLGPIIAVLALGTIMRF